MTASFRLEELNSQQIHDAYPRIRGTYEEVYAEPPYSHTSADTSEFDKRFAQQSADSDFRFIAAQVSDKIIGYTYTVTFAPQKWWMGAVEEPPLEILRSPKLAVIELIVLRRYRGKGIGKSLIDKALSDRPEPWAILLVDPQAPALKIYQHWGWRAW